MRAKIRSYIKIILLVILLVVYNEYLIYYIQTFKWHTLKCSNEEDCVKILLVADPQILGEPREGQILLNIFNWDCDRFLAKTYAQAVKNAKPDVVLFLGDLSDEGSVATRDEFYGYVKRLSTIYHTEYPIKHVWIPGDNDIGGENEPIKPEKVKMFSAAFKQPDSISVKFVDIYKTDLLMQNMPELIQSVPVSNRTRVAISHMPLLMTPGRFTLKTLTNIQPAIIFSGHHHHALRITNTLDSIFTSKIDNIEPKDQEQVITIDLKQDEVTEFVVPTSSYRMGTVTIGHGVAYFDGNTQKLYYTIFWSPSRFFQLNLYVAALSLILICVLLKVFKVFVVCKERKVWRSIHSDYTAKEAV